jgi:hypothetical protein
LRPVRYVGTLLLGLHLDGSPGKQSPALPPPSPAAAPLMARAMGILYTPLAFTHLAIATNTELAARAALVFLQVAASGTQWRLRSCHDL